jgi:hypothetical protein
MLMATADDGFWEDEDEAHDWTCVGVALMAVACVKGKRPYGPDGGGEPRPLPAAATKATEVRSRRRLLAPTGDTPSKEAVVLPANDGRDT